MTMARNSTCNNMTCYQNNILQDSKVLNCYTTVAWRIILTKPQSIAIAVSYSFMILPAILSNTVLCVALYKTGGLVKISKCFVFMLSLSDAISGLVTMPGSVILSSAFSHQRCCWLERTVMFIGQTNGHFSFYMILTIAVHRYIKIRPTNNYWIEYLSESTSLKAVFVSSLVLSIIHGFVSTYFFGALTTNIPNIFMLVVRAVILAIVIAFYLRLYLSIKQQIKMSTMLQNSSNEQSSSESLEARRNKRYSRGFFTISLILVMIVISYLPAVVTDIWTGSYTFRGVAAPRISRFLYFLSYTSIFANCSLNAMVFLYRDKDSMEYIRRGLKQRMDPYKI